MPSTLVAFGSQRVLVDVGDGTIARLVAHYGTIRTVDFVFLTECSGERVSGLVALLNVLAGLQIGSMHDSHVPAFLGKLPTVCCPIGCEGIVRSLEGLLDVRYRELDVREVGDGGIVQLGGCRAGAIELSRSPRRLGYCFAEPSREGRLNVRAAVARGIKPGPAFARLKRGEVVDGVAPEEVLGAPRPGRRLAVAGVSRAHDAMLDLAARADLLVVPAHHTDERWEMAALGVMCTGVEAAVLANAANARVLALHHIGAATSTSYARIEAAQFHPAVVTPRDGEEWFIPLPDRGPPTRQ